MLTKTRLVCVAAVAGAFAAQGASLAAAASAPAGCNSSLPVVAHLVGGQPARLPAGARLPIACASETGYATSESTIAVAGDGTLIYSPAQTENSLTRSLDGGASWNLTYPANEQPTTLWNTTDAYVIADRRTGRVFWARATGPVRSEGSLGGAGLLLAAAYGFQVYSSADNGKSWGTADYSTAPTGDWEKVFVGPPPPASTGAAQPVGYPDVVYLCANSPLEVSGPGRLCYKSLDGGATFTIDGYSSPTASNPPDSCPPLDFNTGVVDSSGTTYQPVDCQRSAYVLVSHDEGSSYSWIPEPDAPTGTPTSGTNLKLAVDAGNNLYALWTAGGLPYMAVSRDHARSWSRPLMIAAPGLTDAQLPSISAGASGHVGITYYASTNPNAQLLSAYITQTSDALSPQPLFYSAALNDPAHPIFHDYGLSDSPRADFIGAAFDRSGTSFWAGAVKQLGTPDSSGYIQTTGYVGTLLFPRSTAGPQPARISRKNRAIVGAS
jgi:hypothetical protein